jgi:hypothetical protein
VERIEVDLGGWISGPCIDVESSPVEMAKTLAWLRGQFPTHDLGATMLGGRTKFYAYGKNGAQPHTLITSSLSELASELLNA